MLYNVLNAEPSSYHPFVTGGLGMPEIKIIAFYCFAFIPIAWQTFVLSHPQTVSTFISYLPKKLKDIKGYTRTQLVYGILREFYFVWICVGMFSSQKVLFLPLLLLGLINIKKSMLGLVIDGLISIFLLLIIILNRFDWHVDLMQYISLPFMNH